MPHKPRTHPVARSDYEAITRWLQHYACFRCRKAFKKPFPDPGRERLCPQCRQPMTNMGTDFKAPAHQEVRQWRKVERLAEAGVKFFPQWPDGRPSERPDTLDQVSAFLRRLHPPGEGEKLLEQLSQKPQRPQALHEGKLKVQGFAPHQTFHLLGRKLVVGDRVQVLRDEGWVDAEVWGNLEEASHLRTLKLVENRLWYAGTVALDGNLRLRWPQ